jgi:hypothetical protein
MPPPAKNPYPFSASRNAAGSKPSPPYKYSPAAPSPPTSQSPHSSTTSMSSAGYPDDRKRQQFYNQGSQHRYADRQPFPQTSRGPAVQAAFIKGPPVLRAMASSSSLVRFAQFAPFPSLTVVFGLERIAVHRRCTRRSVDVVHRTVDIGQGKYPTICYEFGPRKGCPSVFASWRSGPPVCAQRIAFFFFFFFFFAPVPETPVNEHEAHSSFGTVLLITRSFIMGRRHLAKPPRSRRLSAQPRPKA